MPGENARQFLDTNFLVYAQDRSAGEMHARAKSLLRTLWDTQQGYLSVQVLQEFYVAVTQFELPRTVGAARCLEGCGMVRRDGALARQGPGSQARHRKGRPVSEWCSLVPVLPFFIPYVYSKVTGHVTYKCSRHAPLFST